ncbi:MAG: baseplate J/gp47 family protein [Aeromonas sp.]
MASTIDENGFNRQRYQELRRSIAQDFADDGLPDVTNNLQSVPARIVSQTASLQERNDSYVQAVLESFNPYGVRGVQQDRLAPLMGKRRNKAANSTCPVLATADANGCTIPAGSLVSNGTNKLRTLAQIVLGPNGSGTIQAEAIDDGPLQFPIGTINKIITPIFGWASVTNQVAGQVGVSRETDTQLRFRMLKSQSVPSSSVLGIFTALSEIDGVTYCYVDDNKTDAVNAKGLQPRSVFAVIAGGNDDEIADVLLEAEAGGIGSYQNISGAVMTQKTPYNPANRQQVPVYFCRPTDAELKYKVVIQADPKLPPDYAKQIKDALVSWTSALETGTKIIASRLYSPINTVQGFEINLVQVAKKTGALSNEVVLQPFERPVVAAADIEIQVVA